MEENNAGHTIRQSNYELLRIVAMFSIVIFHISRHGNWGNGGVFFPEEMTINAFFLQSLLPLGKIGVDVFVLISGYFLINSTKDTWPKIVKLWLEVLFYSIVISIAFIFINDTEYTDRQIVSILTPILSNIWWFATTYLLMFALSPFINKMLHSCDESSHLKLIMGLIVLWVIVPFFTNLWVEFNNLIWFITLYVIAAYIRMYPDRFKKKTIAYFGLSFVFFAIMIAVTYILDITGFISEFWSIYNPIDLINTQNSPFSLVISFYLFLAFSKWNLKHNNILNIMAGTTFGIYLIHDHPLVRGYIYSEVFDCFGHTFSDYLIPYVLAIAVIVFLSCMLVELIRSIIIDRL